jgi:hypothetical protein
MRRFAMATKLEVKLLLLGIVAAVVLASGMTAMAKKPTPPPPVDPPVNYWITWFDSLGRNQAYPNGMSDVDDVGTVIVGTVYDTIYSTDGAYNTNHTAFVYLASLDQVDDLNDLIADPSFDGWTANAANGINMSGQIVGQARNDETSETRGFVFDMFGSEPSCVLLPVPVNSPGQTAVRVNVLGDVVAAEGGGWKTLYGWDAAENGYFVVGSWQTGSSLTAFNDFGQILLVDGRRYTPGIGWENFGTTYGIQFAMGMNNFGTFVGKRETTSKKPRRFCFRFTDGDPDQMLDIMESSRSAWDVNWYGDTCITDTRRAFLYTDEEGLWALDDLVTGATVDVEDWENASITYARHINDRDETGFGSICGNAVFSTTVRGKTTSTMHPFLLTPLP